MAEKNQTKSACDYVHVKEGGASATEFGSQFTIKTLLITTAMVAISLIPVSVTGSSAIPLSVSIFIVMLATYLFHPYTSFWVYGLLLLVLFGLLLPVVQTNRGYHSIRPYCMNNMRQLVLAMHNFESAYGHFPPAFTTDVKGNPLHSWRVLLLPYLECQALYDQIDLTVPWDHPYNLQFHDQMPECFRCLSTNLKLHQTSYLAIAGDDMVWAVDGTPRKFDDITDGCSNTICLVESVDHPVHWMSPHNPDYDEIVEKIARRAKRKRGAHMFSGHPGGSNVALCDGSCRFCDESLTPAEIKPAFTHNAQDAIDLEW